MGHAASAAATITNMAQSPSYRQEPPAARKHRGLGARLLHGQRRRNDWMLAQAEGARVLVIGCGDGRLLFALARQGVAVLCVDPDGAALARVEAALAKRPAEQRARVRLRAGEVHALEPDETGFDTALVNGVIDAHDRPEELMRGALGCLREGGRLAVTVGFGYSGERGQARPYTLGGLVELLRPLCAPEHLSVEDGFIRFAGRRASPEGNGWDAFGPEALLRISERAMVAHQVENHRELSFLRQEIDSILWSVSYQAGHALVVAAKDPSQLWRLPGQLLRMYLAGRRAGRRRPAYPDAPDQLVEFPAFNAPAPAPERGPVIATILDPFSEACLRYEAALLPLTRKGWREEMARARPAFLFVESAWRGNDGEWSYLIANFGEREGNPLAGLLAYCKERRIPTVFWNKEDPPNFQQFVDAAVHFDVIFTSDANCIPRYLRVCGHERVYALPFAAQPRIHNPWRMPDWPEHPLCFAGSWFGTKYPQRMEALTTLLDPALEFGVHIFDRNQGLRDPRYQFPERYQAAIRGTLPYEKMLTAYRCYRVMLSTNSVTDSSTMFSRRVFESLACGVPVVSTESEGMTRMLNGHVRVTRNPEETRRHVSALLGDEEARQREAHRAYRYVHAHHTYRHRMDDVIAKLGFPPRPAPPRTVSVVMATMRPRNVARCLENFAKQTYPAKELLLVLNNAAFDVDAVREQARTIPQVRVLHVEGTPTLGDCLNRAVRESSGEYVAKMDDDDHYGVDYLSDAMLAAAFSDAEVIGKGTYFAYLEGREEMGLRQVRKPHTDADWVSGSTLVIRLGLLRDVPFRQRPRGTDTAFLDDAAAEGARVYSADPFNFVLVRASQRGDHTWQIREAEFLKLCRDLRPGLDLSRAMV